MAQRIWPSIQQYGAVPRIIGQVFQQSLGGTGQEVYSRGVPHWTGSINLASSRDDAMFRRTAGAALQNFFMELEGQLQLARVPLAYATQAAPAWGLGLAGQAITPVNKVVGQPRHYQLPAGVTVNVGEWVSIKETNRSYVIRAVNGRQVTLYPQDWFPVGERTLIPCTHLTARAASAQAPRMEWQGDALTGGAWDWIEDA